MTTRTPSSLQPEQLRKVCDPSTLNFKTTDDLQPLHEPIGQDLAMRAVRFGLDIDHPGYNIYAVGLPGSGRATMIRHLLEDRAVTEPTPPDWCYVSDFDSRREPHALELPAGHGPKLRDDIDGLLTELETSLPRALQSDEFRNEQDTISERGMEAQRELIEEFQKTIDEERYAALVQTPTGFVVVPALGNEPIDDKQLQSLPDDQKDEILERRREMEKSFAEVQRRVRDIERAAQHRIRDLQRSIARDVVAHCVGEIRADWESVPAVTEHLDRLAEEIVDNAEQFSDSSDEMPPGQMPLPTDGDDPLDAYRVNVIVCHTPESGAPVVQAENPTYHHVIGRIEHRVQFGAMYADFRDIIAGAIHEANGGYLILEAREIVERPLAWTALKNSLRTGSIRMEEIIEYTSPIATTTLRPEPIPLNVRVVLIGDPYTYHMLHAYDHEFREQFKVKADFSPYMDRDAKAERGYGEFIAARCEEESLPPFDASAVGRVVELGSRLAQYQDRLSAQFGSIGDLVREAAFFARASERDTVTAEDVRRAVLEREQRVNRPEREILNLIEEDILTVEPRGEKVGQLYGLAVLSAAEHAFARPIKVEASAFMGTSGLVDIEREVRLGGPLHNKGVLVLSGYLGDLFAQDHPLIMSASLSFDQLYEEVEGDSASAAELYALVSAIAEVPLRQGVAITGALNQKGDIQPIGGVTTKIEGFYQACKRRGLTGDQGVIIPERNMSNLVLGDEVVDAVKAGQFNVWSIRQVEEGWEILAGMVAGDRGPDGRFPEDSVYGRAAARLASWASASRDFSRAARRQTPEQFPEDEAVVE